MRLRGPNPTPWETHPAQTNQELDTLCEDRRENRTRDPPPRPHETDAQSQPYAHTEDGHPSQCSEIEVALEDPERNCSKGRKHRVRPHERSRADTDVQEVPDPRTHGDKPYKDRDTYTE